MSEWLNARQAVESYPIGRRQLYNLTIAGKVRARKMTPGQRGRVIFNRQDLDRYFNSLPAVCPAA